jgi:hypothetical protein
MALRISTGSVNAIANAIRTLYANAVIAIYTGAQPANSDLAESGTLLGYITKDSGDFEAGVATNGLNWEDAANGVCAKPTDEEWSITPIASGTAGYGRLYTNAMVTGVSSSGGRIDLACGVGTGELKFSTTTLISGVKSVVNVMPLTIPKNA